MTINEDIRFAYNKGRADAIKDVLDLVTEFWLPVYDVEDLIKKITALQEKK